ncbi:MAG: flagellar accessory protein FlaH [Anaerolineae bacterium]|nr:flagellar accessory protein FlaH [Anaerolineae bacterium]
MVQKMLREERQFISTGNAELDEKIGGGLPAGSLILIEGSSGAGKSVVSQQMIWGALHKRMTVALFTSESTVRSLIRQMQSIDLDILDFLLMGRVKIYPIELAHLGDYAPPTLFGAMQREANHDLLVVDSFTAALNSVQSNAPIIRYFEQCKRLTANGTSIINVLHSYALEETLMNPLRSMCDVHLRLRSEQDGQRIVKTLEVLKVRGGGGVTGAVVGFEVEPGWGFAP